MMARHQLHPDDYDIVVFAEEEEPQSLGTCGSFADGKGAPTPEPSWIQPQTPVQEQMKVRIPMWQAALRASALGA